MNESVTRAAQGTTLVVADLLEALACANTVYRPEGCSLADRATAAYLADCLEAARKLRADLERIAG